MTGREQDEGRKDQTGGKPFERRTKGEVVDSDTYRGPDRRSEEQRPSQTRKWRESLEKWRQPLIGLAMAGAAAPLVDQVASSTAAKQPGGETDAAKGAKDPRGVGEQVGDRWRAAAESRHRELTVAGAVSRYGISQQLATDIYDIAVEEKIEPEVAYGLVNTESTFREEVTSWAGARGLTQVMPSTARWIMEGPVDLFDPQENLRTGFRYLRRLIDDYGGDLRTALLAYNRGPGTVNRILERGGNPDNGYADKVLDG